MYIQFTSCVYGGKERKANTWKAENVDKKNNTSDEHNPGTNGKISEKQKSQQSGSWR